MSNFFCYNNRFYEKGHPAFGLNRAMKYGDGLFESIRVINGDLQFLPLHFERLLGGMRFLNIEIDQSQFEEIKVCIEQLLIKNEIDHGGKVRLTVFRSGKGLYSPQTNRAAYFIEAEQLDNDSYKLDKKGINIEVAKSAKIYPNQSSRFKTLNLMPYILASIEKDQRFVDDLILLNQEGRIVEATSSNIFLVRGNRLYTPAIEEGCLSGVMRKVLIQCARNNGFTVEETNIPLDLLKEADEVFLTNAIQRIQWVASYQKKRYFNKISQKLHALLTSDKL